MHAIWHPMFVVGDDLYDLRLHVRLVFSLDARIVQGSKAPRGGRVGWGLHSNVQTCLQWTVRFRRAAGVLEILGVLSPGTLVTWINPVDSVASRMYRL